ncbi:hypothetical protein IVB22_26640 [Bradyrhizobium sp. 190]|uniref:hypothetical protein n=1 Tax=Bradyrhizobium sp. 190 TaxID=2782658 RepID=UPI001FF72E0A|nr:hypothetical protein [Bradyrhizobium sp. 190]MCK1516070.1 hypothetical protein [Bradyrhizobium sp. 190]
MTRSINSTSFPNALPECGQLRTKGSMERRIPMALVIAAAPHLGELKQVIDQCIDGSPIHVITTEFKHSVLLAIALLPDLILVASPPTRDALKTCQRLLENSSTRTIPICLIALDTEMVNDVACLSLKAPTKPTAGELPYRLKARRDKGLFAEDNHSVAHAKRRKQLLSIIDLLRNAEAEMAELDLETSAMLLGAAMADVAQHLE